MKYITLSAILLFTIITSAKAETITVGPSHEYDYPVIQTAVNFAEDGDTIAIADGSYTETVVIVQGKDVTIAGNESDRTAVVLKGSITVNKQAKLELKDVTIKANNQPAGVLVKTDGYANISHTTVTGGTHGIVVSNDAIAEALDTTVQQATRHGVLVKKRSNFSADGLTARNNTKAGVRCNRVKYFSLTESTMRDNHIGVLLFETTRDNAISNTTFQDNGTGIKLIDAEVTLDNNTFTGNTTNQVEE